MVCISLKLTRNLFVMVICQLVMFNSKYFIMITCQLVMFNSYGGLRFIVYYSMNRPEIVPKQVHPRLGLVQPVNNAFSIFFKNLNYLTLNNDLIGLI